MSEFRTGSVEWRLKNRTAERDALQETVDHLQARVKDLEEIALTAINNMSHISYCSPGKIDGCKCVVSQLTKRLQGL